MPVMDTKAESQRESYLEVAHRHPGSTLSVSCSEASRRYAGNMLNAMCRQHPQCDLLQATAFGPMFCLAAGSI